MSLYELTVTGTTLGQQSIWRSNWRQIDIDPLGNLNAYRLLQALGYNEAAPAAPVAGSAFALFMACALEAAGIESLFVRNLFDPLDFFEIPLPTVWIGGQDDADVMPPFICGQWRSSRTNLLVRRGHMSTWGIAEENVTNDSVVSGVDLTVPMDDFAEVMSAPVTHTIGLQIYSYRNAILGKERYMVAGSGTDPITNPARWAYKYYPTIEEQLVHAAIGVTWTRMSAVSSRNSRKVGRGR